MLIHVKEPSFFFQNFTMSNSSNLDAWEEKKEESKIQGALGLFQTIHKLQESERK